MVNAFCCFSRPFIVPAPCPLSIENYLYIQCDIRNLATNTKRLEN